MDWPPKPLEIPLTVGIQIEADYDVRYMQDRWVARLVVEGRPVGPYAIKMAGDGETNYPPSLRTQRDLTEVVLDGLSNGITLRSRLERLEQQVADLEEEPEPGWLAQCWLYARARWPW